MKYRLFCWALLTLTLSLSPPSASAQVDVGTDMGSKSNILGRRPDVPLGNIFLSGKVVTDDGTVLTEHATIQTICNGQKHNETYTDSHGQFSFELVTRSSAVSENGAEIGDADSSPTNPTFSIRDTQRDWKDCQLQAVLPGFTSDVVQLSTISPLGRNDLGRIVLHRMEQIQGTTISATSAAAPSAARKAFEKGRDQEKKNKWDVTAP